MHDLQRGQHETLYKRKDTSQRLYGEIWQPGYEAKTQHIASDAGVLLECFRGFANVVRGVL